MQKFQKELERWALTGLTLLVGFAFAGVIGTQIHNFRMQSNTDTFSVTTAANVTTANVTLSQSLLRQRDGIPDEITNLTSTLNETGNISYAYDGLGSKSLQIYGLNAGATRDLTITYNGQRGGDGDKYMATVGPFMALGVLALIHYGIYRGHKNYRSGGNRE